jgi:hypothetical protein
MPDLTLRRPPFRIKLIEQDVERLTDKWVIQEWVPTPLWFLDKEKHGLYITLFEKKFNSLDGKFESSYKVIEEAEEALLEIQRVRRGPVPPPQTVFYYDDSGHRANLATSAD